jgi:hypothetical protein
VAQLYKHVTPIGVNYLSYNISLIKFLMIQSQLQKITTIKKDQKNNPNQNPLPKIKHNLAL